MLFPHRILLLGVIAVVAVSTHAEGPAALRNWPAWRGPLATGVASQADPPLHWSETNHVRWKVEIPGRGTASPIVWDDQIFILAAVPVTPATVGASSAPKPSASPGSVAPERAVPTPNPAPATPAPPGESGNASPARPGAAGSRDGSLRAMVEQPTEEQRFVVLALDRATGKVRWQRTARTELPHEGHHKDHGYASASASTDGEVLVVPFGSHGLYVYDLKGALLWQKDFGRMRTRNSFGEGSSATLHGDRVLVLRDHEGEDDFIVALDKGTGRELWRQHREEPTGWTTPVVVEHAGRKQVVVNGTNRVRSYDFETGEPLWQAGGQTTNAIPTVVAGHGLAFAASGLRGSALHAIRLDARGEVTGTDAIAWSLKKATPYVPSPLLYDDLLYFYSGNNAQLSIHDAKSGTPWLEAERLEGLFGVYASPTAAAGRVYLVGRDGATWVVRHGRKLEVLAKNRLDDNFDATPALVGSEIILRGRQSLYCLAEK